MDITPFLLKKIENKTEVKVDSNCYDEYKIGDSIGGFYGILKQPKAKGDGFDALFFADTPQQEDIFNTLNFSFYNNINVNVNVYFIKNSDGLLCKNKNNEFESVGDFCGTIKKTENKKVGVYAKIYVPNGVNGDKLLQVCKAKYLEGLVYVSLSLASKNVFIEQSQINYEHTLEKPDDFRVLMVKKDFEIYNKNKIKFEKGEKILRYTNFFTNKKLKDILLKDKTIEDYKKWLQKEGGCSFCSENKGVTFKSLEILDGYNNYNVFYLCKDHENNINYDFDYLEAKNKEINDNYILSLLKEELGVLQDYYINISALYLWCNNRGLSDSLPIKFKELL